MEGGGPFGLEPGQWTGDTAMALCLADSLVYWRADHKTGRQTTADRRAVGMIL